RVAALGEGAKQVKGGRRLAVSHLLARRIRYAPRFGEFDAVDDVTPVGGERHAINRLVVRGARLGELACYAPDLHHRLGAGEGQHDRHLQEHAEKIADVIGAMFREALGAIATLEQKRLAIRDGSELLLELARLACKDK